MKTFLIFGQPRTGTTLLRTGLNAHPDVVCLGEVFNQHADVRQKLADSAGVPVWKPGQPQLDYVRDLLSLPPAGAQAFGMKIVAGQLQWRQCGGLKGMAGLFDVVFACTRHPLSQFVSNEQAMETGRWNIDAGETPPPEAQTVTVDRRRVRQLLRHHAERNDRYARLGLEVVPYHELAETYGETMKRVYARLGVKDVPSQQQTQKLRGWSIPERIRNWDEVESALAQHADEAAAGIPLV